MLKILTTALLAVLSIILVAAGLVYTGAINVAADNPHFSPVHALLKTVRERSIAVRTRNIEVPDLSDAELIRSGAGNYDAMCVACHLAPGSAATELSEGLNPAPPNLADANRMRDPASDFWTIKHGIKATGMPAWGKRMADPYIWGLVALLEQLPALTPVEYRALVAASNGHQHGGSEADMLHRRGGRADPGTGGEARQAGPAAGADHHTEEGPHPH